MESTSLYETNELLEKAEKCENISEISLLIQQLRSGKDDWVIKINAIIDKSGLSNEMFGQLCGVSKTTVRKWRSGSIPQSREMFVRIGFVAHMTVKELSHFLIRYGKYSGLYSRSLEDSICIFVLRHPEEYHWDYGYVIELQNYFAERLAGKEQGPRNGSLYETQDALDYMLTLNSMPEFEKFVVENVALFQGAYRKLYHYILAFIYSNSLEYWDFSEQSINQIATEQKWSSSLRHTVLDIKRQKWLPMRRKLIVLGLRLNMDVVQINEMLNLAQMEPLCAKDKIECAIIYAVDNLLLSRPDIRYEQLLGLRQYNQEQGEKQPFSVNETFIRMFEGESFHIDDTQTFESVGQYVKQVLSELNVEEARQLISDL